MSVRVIASDPPSAGDWVRERWWVSPVATELPAWNTKWHLASGELVKRPGWAIVRVVTACGRRLALEWRKGDRVCIELARRAAIDTPLSDLCNCVRIAARRRGSRADRQEEAPG